MNADDECVTHGSNSESPHSEDTKDKANTNPPKQPDKDPDESPVGDGAAKKEPSLGFPTAEIEDSSSSTSEDPPWNDKNDRNDENDTGRISAKVYQGLPKTLSHVAREIEDGVERDVFLTGALPVVAGALPNVRFKYGGHWQSFNLYAAVIAPAGAGKGKMRHARKLAEPLNQRLHKETKERRSQWRDKKESEDQEAGPRPPYKRYYLPADSSAASLKDGLAGSPSSVIFETEFKTLSNVLSQEWGQFRDVLLKGFQNEPVEVDRQSQEPKVIEHPAPSMAVSGTPGTFSEVIGDTEDGLFSRFAFYRFEGEPEWKSQFGGVRETSLDQAVDRAAETLEKMYRRLEARADNPLYVTFTEEAKRVVDDAASFVMEHWKSEGVRPELYSSLKRAALRAVRIGAIMRLLQHCEQGNSLAHPKSIEVGRESIEIGLRLSFTYLTHALRIASQFGSKNDRSSLNRKQRRYLDALPKGEFKTSEAKSIAEEVGVSKRTAQRWLNRWDEDTRLIEKVKQGVWQRVQDTSTTENVPSVIPVISVIPVFFDTESAENEETDPDCSEVGASSGVNRNRNGVAEGGR